MGTNNKQRRAAKQRKRARERRGGGSRPRDAFDAFDETAVYGMVDLQVTSCINRIIDRQPADDELTRRAESLVRRVAPVPREAVQAVLIERLTEFTDRVVGGGWGPGDLVELVSRCASRRHVPALLTVVYDEARRNTTRRSSWLAALSELGDDPHLHFATTDELASGLQVAALLASVPLLDASELAGAASTDGAAPHPKLARVRALLAKAESTSFDEEADALSAKAQELIGRYALGRLLEESTGHRSGTSMQVRRIWLDAPYVRAKSTLVHEVALANRARAVMSERHGFSLVVGAAHDLDAVDLLVTSLLVQANRAMLRHGRRHDRSGTSRTRSFRQSFLLAYAGRIGQRLRETNEAIAAEDTARFVPVLRDHETRVTQAFEAMVPHIVMQETSVSNHEGYFAGLAAADLALLDVNGQIAEQAG